jgi:hypothetical protein
MEWFVRAYRTAQRATSKRGVVARFDARARTLDR